MNHDEASELLAALALDAVDSDERAAIEAHVAQCPRCQSELDALREVAAAMGNSVESLPEGLWSSISSRIYEVRPDDSETAPPLRMAGLSESGPMDNVRDIRSSVRRRTVLTSLATAAAAAIVILSLSLASANGHVSQLQSALGNAKNSTVQAALAAPHHRVVDLVSSSDARLAQFVLLPDGRGYLVSSHMPELASNLTYQLWGIIDGRAISIGLMGHSPGQVTFTVSGSPTPSALDVTIEPSGGSPSPTSPVVASGAV